MGPRGVVIGNPGGDQIADVGEVAKQRLVQKLVPHPAVEAFNEAVLHRLARASTRIGAVAPNLLDRDFTADRPNQQWAGDISYIWTHEGWLYLAVILDLHSRRLIGWAVSNRMKRDLAIRALKMAIALRAPPKGCSFHSARGSQYCSHDYQKILREHSFQLSMSAKGNCYDNAAVDLLQNHQGRADLVQVVGNPSTG